MTAAALTAFAAHGPHWGSGGPSGSGFFPITPLVVLLLVAAAIVTALILTRRGRLAAPRREAESHLATRYAAGEIGEDEYRARRAVLREKP